MKLINLIMPHYEGIWDCFSTTTKKQFLRENSYYLNLDYFTDTLVKRVYTAKREYPEYLNLLEKTYLYIKAPTELNFNNFIETLLKTEDLINRDFGLELILNCSRNVNKTAVPKINETISDAVDTTHANFLKIFKNDDLSEILLSENNIRGYITNYNTFLNFAVDMELPISKTLYQLNEKSISLTEYNSIPLYGLINKLSNRADTCSTMVELVSLVLLTQFIIGICEHKI